MGELLQVLLLAMGLILAFAGVVVHVSRSARSIAEKCKLKHCLLSLFKSILSFAHGLVLLRFLQLAYASRSVSSVFFRRVLFPIDRRMAFRPRGWTSGNKRRPDKAFDGSSSEGWREACSFAGSPQPCASSSASHLVPILISTFGGPCTDLEQRATTIWAFKH